MQQMGQDRYQWLKDAVLSHPVLLPAFFALLTFLVLLPAVFLVDLPKMDVICRYAPMAEAFAEGDWELAFHPRVPPYFPAISGCIAKFFGCSGFLAVKLASLLSFSLAIAILILIFRKIFDLRTTMLAGVLAILCSDLMRIVIAGLRESSKALFMFLATYALIRIWQEKRSAASSLLLGAACALMCYVRDDSILFAGCFLLTALLFEIFRSRVFPWRTIVLSGITMFILFVPLLALNYHWTGYPVPSHRFVPLAYKILPQNMFHIEEKDSVTSPKQQPQQTVYFKTEKTVNADGETLSTRHFITTETEYSVKKDRMSFRSFLAMLWEMLSGFYLVYFLPALVCIVFRIRNKKWTEEETILCAIPVLHAFFIATQIIIADHKFFFADRYELPFSILFCGWTAGFTLWLYEYSKRFQLSEKTHKILTVIICVIFVVSSYLNGISREIREWTSSGKYERRQVLFQWVKMIREDYHGPDHVSNRLLSDTEYHSFRLPRVFSDELEELGYLCGGENFRTRYAKNRPTEPAARLNFYLRYHCNNGYLQDYAAKIVPKEWLADPPEIRGYQLMDRVRGKKHCYMLWKFIGWDQPVKEKTK